MRLTTLAVCVLVLTGCPLPAAGPEPTPPLPLDTDGDGVPDGDDCAPEDPSVYPGAEEVCDGVDVDCVEDPEDVDEDADGVPACDDCDDADPTLHTWDADADGVTPCDGDCDDADAARFPGNPEVDDCDGVDSDCVFEPDEGDVDGDGALACADDCDDALATVHPGHEEICDGIDNNCDGTRDDIELTPVPLVGEVSLGEAQTTFLGEFGGDNLGSRVVALGDVNGDGHQDFLLATFVLPGGEPLNRSYLVLGPICGEVQLTLDAGPVTGDVLWSDRIAAVGDVDGDGLDDIGIDRFVFYGRTDVGAESLWRSTEFPTGAVWSFYPPVVQGVGDLNGDGFDDVAVLSDRDGPNPDPTQSAGVGQVQLFHGPLPEGSVSSEAATASFMGTDMYPAFEGFGRSVASGDFTGDGVPDLAIGLSLPAGGGPAGSQRPANVYIFEGPLSGDYEAAQTPHRLEGEIESDFGRVLASGDLNADGIADLLVGHAAGGHRLFFGPITGVIDGAVPDLVMAGPPIGSMGGAIAFGDVDGDGIDDLVGNSLDNTYGAFDAPEGWTGWHRVEVVLGSTTGVYAEASVVGVGRTEVWMGKTAVTPAGEGEALSVVPGGGLLVGAPRAHNPGFTGTRGGAHLIWLTE